jgi:hypothetical protein
MLRFARPLRYCLVSIGVPDNGGASLAGNDAIAFHALLLGGAGPLADDAGAYLLLGRDATAAHVDASLRAIARTRPDVVVFFFAGHAGRDGLGLRDRVYPYSHLRELVSATNASRSLVVLDACMTGNYSALLEKGDVVVGGLGGLVSDPNWRAALLASSPGPRVITATDRTRTTGQGAVVSAHGDLTGALLLAARHTNADVLVGATGFVSDTAWYRGAKQVLAQHGIDRGAQRIGGAHAFPIVRAEASAPLGSAFVLGARLLADGRSIIVDLHATGRRFVGTRVNALVTSSLTGAVAEFAAKWMPEGSSWRESITCDISGRFDDRVHRYWGQHGFDMSVRVTATDGHGRILASQVVGWHDLRYVA